MNKVDVDHSVAKNLSRVIALAKPLWLNNMQSYGVTKEMFVADPVPDTTLSVHTSLTNIMNLNVYRSDYRGIVDIAQIDSIVNQCMLAVGANIVTNAMCYAPMSTLPWHTDEGSPGKRLYYTFTSGQSIFRYQDVRGNICDDFDNIGWTARMFEISDSSQPLWHCVWTEKIRFSFGFKYD